ncbi:Ubiquitin-conjugating enzyme E2 J1 [Modicella reniformis]|uniref:Ubiquitin-conjugating enzyme E2 J1 n=1 Tax=Modicella reniformis TaxID=1440133 RepID=A0A9P6MI47_9FUNG|nr:Ubiquitin-conjugating enzyme E2 J1 [Modicella reniformis]
MQEARELVREPSTDFSASPLESDIFEWHFTIRGPEDTDFEGGLYHGRILLPNNYPFAPPSLMFLTANGRFELNKKVCLSITGYHPEYWQPAWGIRTVLVAVMGFLPTQSKGAIGGLDTSVEARKALAVRYVQSETGNTTNTASPLGTENKQRALVIDVATTICQIEDLTMSRTWVCPTCCEENVAILPDVAPEDVVRASLNADEMPPEFSFGYEAATKRQQTEETKNNTTNSDKVSQDSKEQAKTPLASSSPSPSPSPSQSQSPSSSPSEPAVASDSHNVQRAGTEPDTIVSHQHQTSSSPIPADAVLRTHEEPPRTPGSNTLHSTTVLRARTSAQATQPQQPQQQQQQAQPQQGQVQVRRTESGIPIWFDALILGLAGLLVVMVVRRFM